MQRKDAHDEELDRIAQRLRAERPQLDPLRLDAIKTTTMSRAQRSGRSGTRRRLAVAGLTVGLMAATTGGVIAAGGAGQSGGNAATAQYGHGVKGFKHHKRRRASFTSTCSIPYNVKLKSVTITLNGKTVLRAHRGQGDEGHQAHAALRERDREDNRGHEHGPDLHRNRACWAAARLAATKARAARSKSTSSHGKSAR